MALSHSRRLCREARRRIKESSTNEGQPGPLGALLIRTVSTSPPVAPKKDQSDGSPESSTARSAFERLSSGPRSRSQPSPYAGAGALQKYGRDLTQEAARGALDPLIGRQDVVQRVLRVLMRRSKNNAVLVGDAGVGKTAVAEGVAQLLAGPTAPPGFRGKRLVSLDAGSLVAGTQYRGAFEERLQAVLTEIRASRGGVLLFVDELHMLINAGRTDGSMDAANLLKPALARGELHCLGATTPEEYRRHIESDAAFARRFQSVTVEEPSVAEAALWLRGLRDRYEKHHGVKLLDSALEAAASYSKRYIPHRRLPDSAIDLLDEAASYARLRAMADGIPVVEQPFHPIRGMSASPVHHKVSDPEQVPWAPGPGSPVENGDTGGSGHEHAGGSIQQPLYEVAHGSEWAGDVQFDSSTPPRPCPHCAMPVRWQPCNVIQIQCTACGFRFLNVPPEQLMLGSTVVSRPKATANTGGERVAGRSRVAVIEKDDWDVAGREEGAMPGHINSSGPALGDHVGASPLPPQQQQQQGDAGQTATMASPGEQINNSGFDRRLKEWFENKGGSASHTPLRVGKEDVLQVLSQATGIPLGGMSDSEQQRLAGIEKTLEAKVIGQKAAVESVAAAVQMGRLGLRPSGRPICSLLFTGPGGVGKSLLAQELASAFYGDAEAAVELNGNDLADRTSVSRLLGPPPGYVGYGQGGELTEPIRRRPHSLVIIDSIDMAHPEVQEMISQVLDGGRLTDSTGRVADFTNAMIVLITRSMPKASQQQEPTSGAAPYGASRPQPEMQGAESSSTTENGGGMQAVAHLPAASAHRPDPRRRRVHPDLLSRVDQVVVFDELREQDVVEVARLKVLEAQCLAEEISVELRIDPGVTKAIAQAALQAGQGCRPVARLVRQHIMKPLAQGILTARLAATGDAPTGHDREEGHTAAAVRLSSAANEPLKTHIDILREAGGA